MKGSIRLEEFVLSEPSQGKLVLTPKNPREGTVTYKFNVGMEGECRPRSTTCASSAIRLCLENGGKSQKIEKS